MNALSQSGKETSWVGQSIISINRYAPMSLVDIQVVYRTLVIRVRSVEEREVAMQAGRELDALITEKVIGYDSRMFPDGRLLSFRKNWGYGGDIPHYSTQIADAWLVVEKMKNDWCNLEFMCGRYQAKFKTGARVIEYKYYEAQADTAPLAICLAALKAVEK